MSRNTVASCIESQALLIYGVHKSVIVTMNILQKLTFSLLDEFDALISMVFGLIPGRTGVLLRRFLYYPFKGFGFGVSAAQGVTIRGKGVRFCGKASIGSRTSLYARDGKLVVGSDVKISESCFLGADGGTIVIGDATLIGPLCVFRSTNHSVNNRDRNWQPGSIYIGSEVWVGCSSSILAGSTIPEGSVIAAGSVVKDQFSDCALIAGVPAQQKRRL